MKNTHTTLDREPLSSEAIRDRQDFNYVLKEHISTRIPLWKSAWFYGPVGIAMVTMVVSAVRMNPQIESNDNNITLAKQEVIGWTGSTDVSDINAMKNRDLVDAVEGSIPAPADQTNTTLKSAEKQVVKPAKTEKSDEIEDNTIVKPGVLAPEKKIVTPVVMRSEPAKTVVKNTMPSIAGVFTGRISVNEICQVGKIDCNNDFEVIAYTIEYDNGIENTVERYEGNEISSRVCAYLKRYNVGSPVFITNIVAADNQGNVKRLPSMSIEPTF
jgi:hypothetical protein